METLSTWWATLTPILKIYWVIAIPFTVFFLLQLVVSFLGGETPDDLPDQDITNDTGFGFQFLTLKNMVGFFTIFGWTGIATIESGASIAISLLVATIAGLLMMTIMAGLFYMLMKAGADGTMKLEKAVGQLAEVYLTIPSRRQSVGKVQVKVMGSLRTLEAITDDEQDIPSGRMVSVSQIVNDQYLLVTTK